MWQKALQLNYALHKNCLRGLFFMNKLPDIFAYLQMQISLDIKLAIAFSKCMTRFT